MQWVRSRWVRAGAQLGSESSAAGQEGGRGGRGRAQGVWAVLCRVGWGRVGQLDTDVCE